MAQRPHPVFNSLAGVSGCGRNFLIMTIAFDIDGTWGTDPNLFWAIARVFEVKGWTVIVVTGAEQPTDKLERLRLTNYPIVYALGILKRDAARAAGYSVNVWVDDMPGTIEPCRILADPLAHFQPEHGGKNELLCSDIARCAHV